MILSAVTSTSKAHTNVATKKETPIFDRAQLSYKAVNIDADFSN